MSKNFNLLYVFTTLLLQFFTSTLPAQPINKSRSAPSDLIKTYGLINSQAFRIQSERTLQHLGLPTDCQVLDSSIVNAFALTDGSLIISKGLLQLTENTDQLAHILAHEYAHIKLKHFQDLNEFLRKPPVFFPKKKLKKLRQKQEQEADEWADEILEARGYDNSQIHHLWQQLVTSEQSNKWSDHMKLPQRINKKKLKTPLKRDGYWKDIIRDLSQRQ